MLENLKANKRRGNSKTQCRLMDIRATLEPNDQTIMDDALVDHTTWSTHGLWVAFTNSGLNISYMAVYRHRADLCSCARNNA